MFVCCRAPLSLRLNKGCTYFRRELFLQMLLLLPLHLEGDDAHTIPVDGGGRVLGGRR